MQEEKEVQEGKGSTGKDKRNKEITLEEGPGAGGYNRILGGEVRDMWRPG